MSKLTTKTIKDMKREFNKAFKFSTGKLAGSTFNLDFVKEKSKTREGLKELKDIYDTFTIQFAGELTGVKNLNDVLKYKGKAKFIESFEELFIDMAKENQVINKDLYFNFLKEGLKLKTQNIEDNYIKFPDEDVATEIPEAQKEIMKGVERTKVKMLDKVQEKGEPKMTDEELKKISDSLVDSALANAVKGIEKKEKMKLTEEQKEVIREQIEMEIEDKISKSSEEAKKRTNVEPLTGKQERMKRKSQRKKERKKESSEQNKMRQEEINDLMNELGISKKEATEVFDIRDELGLSKKEALEQLKMATPKEEIEEGKKAQEEAKKMRSKPKEMTDEEVDEILGTATEQEQEETPPQQRSNENVKMEMKKPDMRTEIDDLQPLPSKADFIPPMRLGTSGKDINELLEDIMYFMKNFKGQLKREGEIFKEVDKTNIEQLRKLHNKIVGKLAPKQKKEEQGKKIGIIVNADEYIREQMKKILNEQVFSNLRPQDVVIDVGSRAAEGRDTNNKDFGDFSVKRTIDGGLASTREAVFRYMPSQNDQDVGEEGNTEKQRKKPNRITMPKSRLNNERTNAIRMNVRNPFRIPQKTMKLKYLY
jgi:hypothetical protein